MPPSLPFPNATFVFEVLLPLGTQRAEWAAQQIQSELDGLVVIDEIRHHPQLEAMLGGTVCSLEHICMHAFFDNRTRLADGSVVSPDSKKVMGVLRNALDSIGADVSVGGFVVCQVRDVNKGLDGNVSWCNMFLELRMPEDFKGQYQRSMYVSRAGWPSGKHAWQWDQVSTPTQTDCLNNELAHLQDMEDEWGVLQNAQRWLSARHASRILEEVLPAPLPCSRGPGGRF